MKRLLDRGGESRNVLTTTFFYGDSVRTSVQLCCCWFDASHQSSSYFSCSDNNLFHFLAFLVFFSMLCQARNVSVITVIISHLNLTFKLLQSHIDSVQNLFIENVIILNVGKTIISFMHRIVGVNCNFKLCNNIILPSQCVRVLGVLFDYDLCFRHHTDYIFSQELKMLVLFIILSCFLHSLYSLCILFSTLVWPKLECASIAWNSLYRWISLTWKNSKKIWRFFCGCMLQ